MDGLDVMAAFAFMAIIQRVHHMAFVIFVIKSPRSLTRCIWRGVEYLGGFLLRIKIMPV